VKISAADETSEFFGHAALRATLDRQVEAAKIVLATRAVGPGDRGSGKNGDVQAHSQHQDGVGVEQHLQHGQVDLAIAPDVQAVVSPGDEHQAGKGCEVCQEGWPLPPPASGRVPHDNGIDHESEHPTSLFGAAKASEA
jgi:hypothetical protein